MKTLNDVAVLACVSKSTASRALARPELVAPATLQRVVAAAQQLGFVPNRAAQGLARGRTGIIALVLPTISNVFFVPIVAGAQEAAQAAGLQVTININPLTNPEDIARYQRLSQEVDGILLVAPHTADEVLASLSSRVPMVMIDRELAGFESVSVDSASAFAELVVGLVENGHQHIAYVGGPENSWQNAQRIAKMSATAASCAAKLEILGPYPPSLEDGFAIAESVRETGVSVVIPYARDLALGMHITLRDSEQRAGKDSCTSGDELEVVGYPTQPMVQVDGLLIGETAFGLLERRIAGSQDAPSVLRLPATVLWT
ncbi:LacI family transcriptional regulator [Arthrobacter sp. UYCu511]|uniref:LacI family DNA-binding transcriptional regulator n=1 Tax=Arthrobacter sp. UYCu511 TaxID=3156337 RepID=UPI003398E526